MRLRESIEGRFARLGLALLAGCLFGAAPVRADEPRLDPNVAPTFEAVNLSLDADQENYTGSVRIELRVAKPTRSFLFHAEEMTIDKATLEGKAGAIAIEVADAGDRGTRRATAQSDLAPGDYVLHHPVLEAVQHQGGRSVPRAPRRAELPLLADGVARLPQGVPVLGRTHLQDSLAGDDHGAAPAGSGQQRAGREGDAGCLHQDARVQAHAADVVVLDRDRGRAVRECAHRRACRFRAASTR